MTQKKTRLLVVDDDTKLRQLLKQYLENNGFDVTSVESAIQARETLANIAVDLIILDVMMPGETGLEFAKKLRQAKDSRVTTPILMLTALGETNQRIEGLEAGVDDYLAKPFEPKELLLRIQSILRRTMSASSSVTQKEPLIFLGDFVYDVSTRILLRDEERQYLTPLEAELLHIFATHAGEHLSRDQLAQLGGVSLSPRTVDVQVARLRRRLEDNGKEPKYLQTVRHRGYVLKPDLAP
ncbi:MAG: response regulator [Holosporales bacterium]